MDIQKFICEICGGNHPTEVHPKPELGRLTDPNYLPSLQELLDVTKKEDDSRESFIKAHENYDEIREIGYEILSREFIETLSNYLEDRIVEYRKNNRPVTILEVGAGNGRLSHFLDERLRQKYEDQYKIISTGIHEERYKVRPAFPIEDIDYQAALKKYKPTIVISSWMPLYRDWTKDFRATPSVQEYILIGDEGATGDHWKTWGDDIDFYADPDFVGDGKMVPPYEKEGFEASYLDEISEFQVPDPLNSSPSTVSFRRAYSRDKQI